MCRLTIAFVLFMASPLGRPLTQAADEFVSVASFEVDVTPPLGSALCNGTRRPALEIVTPLSARGIVILGAENPIVLCAVDWVGIANESHDRFRQALADAVGTDIERVTLHTLHQHDAPGSDFATERLLAEHGLGGLYSNPEFDARVMHRIASAAGACVRGEPGSENFRVQSAQRVTHVGLGTGKVEKVASNRRILGPDGKVAIQRQSSGAKNPAARDAPEGTIDPLVRMISFWNDDDPVAVLSYYATHPQSYYGRGLVNWDFVGIARQMREDALPGVRHIHFDGAGGNVAAGKYNDGSPKTRPVLAQRLAQGMRLAWQSQKKYRIRPSDIQWRSEQVRLPLRATLDDNELLAKLSDPDAKQTDRIRAARDLTYLRRTAGGHDLTLGCLRIGPARVLHMPGELFVEYQLAAQQMRPNEFVAMAAYGDYGPGYIGTEIAYSQGGYETGIVSRVAPTVERLLINAIATLLDVSSELDAPADVDTRPSWIWNSESRAPGQDVVLNKSFQLRAPVERAMLHVAADFTRTVVSLNRRPLVQIDDYGPWLQLDVTSDLAAEKNQLSLKCRSGDGPAAVAISLEIGYADGSNERIVTGGDWSANGRPAFTLGTVAPELWNVANFAKISPFEDYEQWRRASNAEGGTDPSTFVTQPGFEVDLVRSATADEGSWVSLAIDPQGRITIAREDKGLLRMTLSPGGDQIDRVETINDTLLECRGLLYAYDSLYANANNSKGLYRLRDTNADDQFDKVELLREFPGQVGHGRNDLALGPDGLIYSIHGDSVELASDDIQDRTSPLRSARRGERSEEGHLIRTDANGQHWELVASGLRNPFGIDFNQDGEVFTYDADNEYDMGSPWYRPTRMVQIVSGGDYGWRRKTNGEWPPYFPDHADNALPTVDVGKGSPTAVKSGRRSSFPQHYRRAIFALDWAYGRILACHLSPRGAGYACRVETFLAGRPLNVTDLDFDASGNMFVITGGRKTKSALYRIRYVGPETEISEPTVQQTERKRYSQKSRERRRTLASFHEERGVETLSQAWIHLGDADPVIRNTARIAIEHQPIEQWRNAAIAEVSPEHAATALLALARAGRPADHAVILQQLDAMDVERLTAYAKLSVLQAYRLTLRNASLDPEIIDLTHQRLLRWLQSETVPTAAPLGSGYSVREELARLVADRNVPGAITSLIEILRSAQGQRERMNALYMLCHQPSGWTIDDRVLFFEALGELERTAFSGAGMPGRLSQIREHALTHLTDQQRAELGTLIQPATTDQWSPQSVSRPFVRKWSLSELTAALDSLSKQGDAERGETLFREALCVSCHRVAGRGGVLGPDLSALASRFSPRDILASIVHPSDVIAEKYRSTQVVTSDGRIISGQIVTGGDYRASNLRIATDPLDPRKVVEIAKQEIQVHRPSPVSPMPEGLLDTLTAADVADLIAYLTQPHPSTWRKPVAPSQHAP